MKTINSMIDPRTEGTFTPVYECPQCGESYTDPSDLKWYTFKNDGEKRKQCYMCSFHPDEKIEKIEAIDEHDFQNY